jgi:hypothetical protein
MSKFDADMIPGSDHFSARVEHNHHFLRQRQDPLQGYSMSNPENHSLKELNHESQKIY